MSTTKGDFHIRPWKFTLLIALPIGLALALVLYCLVVGPLVNFCHVGNLLPIAFENIISGCCNVAIFVMLFVVLTLVTLLVGEHVMTKKYMSNQRV